MDLRLFSKRLSSYKILPLVGLMLMACTSTQSSVRGTPERSVVLTSDIESAIEIRQRSLLDSRKPEWVYVSGGGRDCDKEHIACFRKCWNTPPPYPISRGDKGHYKYCTTKCLGEYMDCIKETEPQPLMFPDMKGAKEWLERHKTEILVGTIVVVAGAAFVVATGGSGSVVLVALIAL